MSQRLPRYSRLLLDMHIPDWDAAFLTAAYHPLVRPVVARVTARRLGYMAESFVELGMSKAKASRRAMLLYLSYVGLFNYLEALDLEISDRRLEAYAEELVRTLIFAQNDI